MDKFGLFDVISKLSSNENAINSISNIIKNIASNDNKKTNNYKPNPSNSFSYSPNAIQSILKRHEEISKKIDKEYKNSP